MTAADSTIAKVFIVIDYHRASQVLARFAATLHDPYSLPEVISGLSSHIAELVQVTGAGVMLLDDRNQLRFVSGSDPALSRLEALQLELEEGPCLLAYQLGEEVISQDLATDDRFPRFAPPAIAAGLAAVYSFPMRVGGTVVGATNLYRASATDLEQAQLDMARTLTHVASAYVRHASENERSHNVNKQLQHALDSRVIIEQAKGFLAAHHGCTPDQAFNALRSYARPRNLKLHDLAVRVVERDINTATIMQN